LIHRARSTNPVPDLDFFAHPELIRETRRAKEIGCLEAYFKGTQYDGRPDWFTGAGKDGVPVPLRERKPCIIYPLPKAACQQATRFTFGEGRFPTVAVGATESDDAIAPELAVTAEEAADLTAYLAAVIESAHLKSAMRTLCRHGTSQRTAVAALSVRRGQFAVDMPRARDCWPTFEDADPAGDVQRMTWCYTFDKEVDGGGSVVSQTHFFRRDYTDTEVIFYEDAPCRPGQAPEWRIDEERTRPHGLGFCPVVWIRNLPEPECSSIDGVSLYEDLEDEFDALNFALSQRHRGITYFGTPQAYEAGVDDDEEPGEVARVQRPAKAISATQHPADPYSRIRTAGRGSAADARARKTAPDQIWSYRNSETKVDLIETTGKAFEVATKHVLDVRARILEAIDVVLLDPMTVAGKGEMSAKALALMYAPLLALVDELRDCWWSFGLAKLLSMILRITAVLRGKGIFVPRSGRVAEICSRFALKHETGTVWVPPRMTPSWGAYFSPTNQELGQLVDATTKAKAGKIISPATATRAVAPYYGVTDVEAELEDIEAGGLEEPGAGGAEDTPAAKDLPAGDAASSGDAAESGVVDAAANAAGDEPEAA
jgi:hypothetical protein